MTYACIFLPLPPSTNNLYPGKFSRHLSKQYVAWKQEAWLALRRQEHPRFDGFVDLTISVERTNHPKQDISNRIKAAEDFLVEHGIIADDSHVRRVTAQWHANLVGCRVEIEAAPGLLVTDPIEIAEPHVMAATELAARRTA